MINNVQKSPLSTSNTTSIVSICLVYLLMIIGFFCFIVPNIEKQLDWKNSLKYGATFGLVVYGVYSLTCLSIFKEWSLKYTIIDIVWGAILYGLVSFLYVPLDN